MAQEWRNVPRRLREHDDDDDDDDGVNDMCSEYWIVVNDFH